MTENPYVNYLQYVRDVLGAHSFVQGPVESALRDHFFQPDEKLEIEKRWDVLFVNSIFTEVESLFEKAHHELFEKMFKAMNLKEHSMLAVDSRIMNDREIIRRWNPYGAPKVLIVFKQHPEIREGLRYIDDTSVIETYSPFHLVQNPEYKKITWNHLQQVMAYLNKN